MNMKQTFGAAVIVVTLSLAPSGQEAQERTGDIPPKPHQLAGTWAGISKWGNQVEIDVKPDGGGSWCYRAGNGGLVNGPFNHATVKDNEIAWMGEGVRMRLRPNTKAKRVQYYEDNETTGYSFQMTLRATRKTRCLKRFRLEGGDVANVDRTADTPALVGMWSGTANVNENRVGVLVESIGKRGKVRGRYCTRRLDHQYGRIALFDMDGGSPIITSATRDRDRITMTIPEGDSASRVEFWVDEDDEMRMLHTRFAGELGKERHTGAWLVRGLHPEGCLQRTTPYPGRKPLQSASEGK